MYKKQNKKTTIINSKTKVVVGAYLCRKKKKGKKKKRKGRLYNTYHGLLSDKWIVKRSQFHVSYIISPQSVAIFATSHLLGCIEYWYNSLEDKIDKRAVATPYQVGWIDYTLQNILGQKF